MRSIIKLPTKNNIDIIRLSEKLRNFYDTIQSYPSFESINSHDVLYKLVDPIIESVISKKGEVRILELGAGRTDFPNYLRTKNYRNHYFAQDITDRNYEYLISNCDSVHIGGIETIQGQFDLIVSMFVFEHICTPLEFLENIDRLLSPGGWHILFCPNYEFFGYIPPSIRHLSLKNKYISYLYIIFQRVQTLVSRKPSFLINTDPAVFYSDWFRDSDAVHLVSSMDVRIWHNERAFKAVPLIPKSRGLRSFIQNHLLSINMAFHKSSNE